MTPRPRIALVALASLGLSGCASSGPPGPACAPGEQAAVQQTLYLGTGRRDGMVSAEEWSHFLESVVTPRFPQGLTVSQASGQWRGQDGTIVREASYVLTLVHPADALNDAHVEQIAQAYRVRFEQDAVLRVRSRVCTSY
jgi:hypothetical protein